MTTQKQLEKRFPYMFAGPNIGLSIPKGWMPLFEKMCEDIDEVLGDDKRGFHFSQCKEKFGAARWYWTMEGRGQSLRLDMIAPNGVVSTLLKTPASDKPEHSVSEQISKIIEEAEGKTQSSCIVCGKHAKLDNGGGYFLVLCPTHAAQRKTDTLEKFWDE